MQNNEAGSSIGSFIIIVHRLRDLHRHFLVARIYHTDGVRTIKRSSDRRAIFVESQIRNDSTSLEFQFLRSYVPCCCASN